MLNLDVNAILNQVWRSNPNLQTNANAMQMINVVQNNDQVAGEQIANNILKQYGLTKEQGMQLAQQYFSKRR